MKFLVPLTLVIVTPLLYMNLGSEATLEGSVQRVRPKLMTVATMMIGLVPLLWSQGSGADVMKRVAVPMVGGLFTSAFLTLEIILVVYT